MLGWLVVSFVNEYVIEPSSFVVWHVSHERNAEKSTLTNRALGSRRSARVPAWASVTSTRIGVTIRSKQIGVSPGNAVFDGAGLRLPSIVTPAWKWIGAR